MFLQASVILSTGGCLPQCMLGCHTPHPQEQTPPPPEHTPPWEQTPPEQTPRADTPQEQTLPPSRYPPEQTPPGADTPPGEADSSIRSTSGRYASYWNAFLFYNTFFKNFKLFTWSSNLIINLSGSNIHSSRTSRRVFTVKQRQGYLPRHRENRENGICIFIPPDREYTGKIQEILSFPECGNPEQTWVLLYWSMFCLSNMYRFYCQ